MNQKVANKTRPQVTVLSNAGLALVAEARPFRKTKNVLNVSYRSIPPYLHFYNGREIPEHILRQPGEAVAVQGPCDNDDGARRAS